MHPDILYEVLAPLYSSTYIIIDCNGFGSLPAQLCRVAVPQRHRFGVRRECKRTGLKGNLHFVQHSQKRCTNIFFYSSWFEYPPEQRWVLSATESVASCTEGTGWPTQELHSQSNIIIIITIIML